MKRLEQAVMWAATLVICVSAGAEPRVRADEAGNRALAFPDPGAARSAEGLADRGTPAWTAFGPGGGDVRTIAASPTQPGVVIAGLMSSSGVGAIYRSTDAAGTWTRVADTGGRGVDKVAFATDGTAYAATSDGLFKSVNGGASWTGVPLPTGPATLVQTVITSPTDAGTLWVGMGQYLDNSQTQFVLRSANAGSSWSNISPPATAGKGVTALAVDPANTQRLYAAFAGSFGSSGEVWVTENGGMVWEDRTNNLPRNIFWDITVSGGTAYLAGGQDFGSQFVGLYRSTDAGQNWNELSATWPSRSVTAVAVDPANPMNILVGTQRAGLGRSTNGGGSWTFSVGGTRTFPVNDIEFAPGAAGTVLLGMGSVAVFKSTSGGAPFSPSGSGIRQLNLTTIAVNPVNPGEIALAYNGDNDGGIFTTIDGGANWALAAAPLPRWTKLRFAPDGVLYATHDGPLGRADDGVWRRTAPDSWTDLGPGSPSQLDTVGHDIAVSTTSPQVILFAGQDWVFGGFDAVIWSYNRAGSGVWVKEHDGGIASEEVESIRILNGGQGPVAVASIVNFGQEAGAAGGVLRSPDLGDTWSRSESGYPATWNGWELATRPSQPDTVYVSASANTGTMPAGVYKSVNGGQSWSPRGTANPTFRSMVADQARADVLYGIEVFSGQVYRSVDDGASFQNFSAGLPANSGGRQLVYGGGSRPRLYLATAVGAFATDLTPACAGDFNGVDGVTVQDIFDFLRAYFSNDPRADVNRSGSVTVQDVFDFLVAYFTGC